MSGLMGMWNLARTGFATQGMSLSASARMYSAPRYRGTVKWFDVEKGFGFIESSDTSKDVFAHYSSIVGDGFRALQDGQNVEFEVVESRRGLQADQIFVEKEDGSYGPLPGRVMQSDADGAGKDADFGEYDSE
mmetsp:Transcript_27333/g.76315  ORF Transcript_27333/g.76315 Transcript_27333/m.76315 type:complete len:133 (+) Transcript_27333:51-449(+)|eukprot:CAMPEP_0119119734 /NCGR_PEP_ID=MMETSP1310-20130426/1095_1 /TAXON_ID=464262 /ORGANISM="Genus nov. species nov., Strain RCC2339" /LENGTH=132 /DNA_ID=CAMNT_0007109181 /DNA_START=53 /DNA_END=451 /DNA_ORIENTATION=-